MARTPLFPADQVVGIFRGFSEGGLEFHADIVLPYRSEFQNRAMHGQFLLVQLASEEEAVLGRITSLYAEGRLTAPEGEDYSLRAMAEQRPVPEDLRQDYLKYRVNIRVLGVLRQAAGGLTFAPSHRRLPHLGSWVAFPSDEVLRHIAGHYNEGADLGFFALGEFIWAGDDPRIQWQPWMQRMAPAIITRFPVDSLVSRRTFVFARAGFGKSNLTKLLFSNLYRTTPTVEKRGGRRVPVGTIIFDRDGEYFWPDDKNRPGLCDVPELEDQVVVFTRKQGPSPFYQSFVASDIKLDIRRLSPSAVVSIALSPEKQDQQNVRKLKGLSWDNWERLVNLIAEHENQAPLDEIKEILHLESNADYEAIAARSNMTTIVRMLHDKRSRMLDMLITALRDGKLCVVDVSQLSGEAALVLTGLILQRIFDINQEEFTKRDPQTIPTIAVLEEAQSVLGQGASGGTGPYVAWVKEGRKYDLGAMLITQQPGSIPVEILSQGDNWFIFHLLSEADLQAVRRANAHYSHDLLASLLNEPIPGHCVFWSSVRGTPYPVPLRVISFEQTYRLRDPEFNRPPARTYAMRLREQFEAELHRAQVAAAVFSGAPASAAAPASSEQEEEEEADVDPLEVFRQQAIDRLRQDRGFLEAMRRDGLPWGVVKGRLKEYLPAHLADADEQAYQLVRRALNEIFGRDKWSTEKRPGPNGKTVTWIVLKPGAGGTSGS